MNILLVEDEAIISMVINDHLTELGHDVKRVMRGNEAVEQVKHSNYDLIFLDIGLPDIDGFDVFEVMSELKKELNIVFLTAHSDKKTIKKISDLNCKLLKKPIDYRDMEKMLREHQISEEN